MWIENEILIMIMKICNEINVILILLNIINE